MLTIDDIKNVGFRRAKFGGYKPEDVDAFIDDVQISFEKMTREIRQLNDMVRSLNSQVRKFKEEGQSIKSVISNAQKVAEKSLDDAKIHTDNMISEAEKKSEDMISEAKREVEINKEISERLKSESAKLRQKLDDIYKRHLEIIDEIPADVFAKSCSEEKSNGKLGKEEKRADEPKVDISKSVTSNIRKRFFEIDAKIGKNVSGGLAEASREKRKLFAENPAEDMGKFSNKDKFKDLQFGKDFEIGSDEEESSAGAYSGIFKNKN